MDKILYLAIIIGLLFGFVLNRVTGRKQLSLVNEFALQVIALTHYKAFLDESKVLSSLPYGVGSAIGAILHWSKQQETEALTYDRPI